MAKTMSRYPNFSLLALALLILVPTLVFFWSRHRTPTLPAAPEQTASPSVPVITPPELEPEPRTLTNTAWQWQQTLNADQSLTTPNDPTQFILQFEEETFSSQTDCNNLFGSYQVDGEVLSLGPIAATRMACPASQEMEYSQALQQVNAHVILGDTLTLILARDAGAMTFKAVPLE